MFRSIVACCCAVESIGKAGRRGAFRGACGREALVEQRGGSATKDLQHHNRAEEAHARELAPSPQRRADSVIHYLTKLDLLHRLLEPRGE